MKITSNSYPHPLIFIFILIHFTQRPHVVVSLPCWSFVSDWSESLTVLYLSTTISNTKRLMVMGSKRKLLFKSMEKTEEQWKFFSFHSDNWRKRRKNIFWINSFSIVNLMIDWFDYVHLSFSSSQFVYTL